MTQKPRVKNRELLVASPRSKRFVRETLILPDGQECDWYYLDAPESVVVVPFTKRGTILLVRQVRWNLHEDYGLELPAGIRQADETARAAAARELIEETGYAVDPEALQMLGRYYVLPSETNKYVQIFRATAIEKREEPAHDDGLERYFDMSVVEMSLDEAVATIGTTIQGIETVAALLLASRLDRLK